MRLQNCVISFIRLPRFLQPSLAFAKTALPGLGKLWMSQFAQNIISVAAVAAALITILTLFAHLGKTVRWVMRLPTEIRHYLFRPKLVLLPTAEEIAAYSVKSFESARMTLEEIEEEQRGRASDAAFKRLMFQQSRTAATVLVFGAAFASIEVVLALAALGVYSSDWSRLRTAQHFALAWFFIAFAIFSTLFLWLEWRRFYRFNGDIDE